MMSPAAQAAAIPEPAAATEEPVVLPVIAPSASVAKPAAAKPAPAKARNAEKDGYLKDL